MNRWAGVATMAAVLLASAGPSAAESLEDRARAILAPGPGVRLECKNSRQASPESAWNWKCEVLGDLQAACPRVRLEAETPQGRRSWVVAFDKWRLQDRWVALHPLASGQRIQQSDFQFQPHWERETSLPSQDWLWPAQGSYRLRRSLKSGEGLDPRQLEAIPCCESGCTIAVEHDGGGIRVVMQAQALERGYPGKSLRARLQNGQHVLVWCDAQGRYRDCQDFLKDQNDGGSR